MRFTLGILLLALLATGLSGCAMYHGGHRNNHGWFEGSNRGNYGSFDTTFHNRGRASQGWFDNTAHNRGRANP